MMTTWNLSFLSVWLFFITTNIFHDSARVYGKEIVATKEWQRVGPGDTLPAGLEIRMDLSTGEKWARLIPPNEETQESSEQANHPHTPRCGPSCKARQEERRRRRQALRGSSSNRLAETIDAPAISSVSNNENDTLHLLLVILLAFVASGILIMAVRRGEGNKIGENGLQMAFQPWRIFLFFRRSSRTKQDT